MLYFILILIAILVALLLLRLRVRFVLSADQRLLFLGLGRSGPEWDYEHKTGRIKLFGKTIKTFPLHEEHPEGSKERLEEVHKAAEKKRKPKRERDWRELKGHMPQILSAGWDFTKGVLRSTAVEQLDGRVRAGFESPALTGQAYGYYFAVAGMIPGALQRVHFEPDWLGPSFTGSLRVSVALPLYALVWRALVLVIKLPKRRLLRFALGKKKGDRHE